MSLKDITHDLHRDAERTLFAKKLVQGTFTTEEYANYLWQMVIIYKHIESSALRQGMLKNLPGIERTLKIYEDCVELVGPDHALTVLPETQAYAAYLIDLDLDSNRCHLMKAHMYVRHMGDLFGGQIIAKKVKGSGRFYQFDNPEELKLAIRAELTDELGDEARIAFQYAISIMNALSGYAPI